MVGASMRQGMHHSAQKSTRTGTSALRTSVSKLASVNSRTLGLAIRVFSDSMIGRLNGGCQCRIGGSGASRGVELMLDLEHGDDREDEHDDAGGDEGDGDAGSGADGGFFAEGEAPEGE